MEIKLDIIEWLKSRPNWQQEAVLRIITKGELDDVDYNEIADLCRAELTTEFNHSHNFEGFWGISKSNTKLRLESISDIIGIDNLKPRIPLKFGNGNISVVYGGNGAGKSGYVRIIKSISGKTNYNLRSNAFEELPKEQTCCIKFTKDLQTQELTWNVKEGPLKELLFIDVFDTDSGQVYLNSEKTVSYIPRELKLFNHLVEVCDKLKDIFQTRRNVLASKLPSISNEFLNTIAGTFYSSLNTCISEVQLRSVVKWDEVDEDEMERTNTRIKVEDPKKVAINKRGQKKQIDEVIETICGYSTKLDQSKCRELVEARSNFLKKNKVSIEAAEKAFTENKLDGVGGDTWKALWMAAKVYSEQFSYPDQKFPVTEDSSRCVLCQQYLDEEGKKRLTEFEAFIIGELELEAKSASTNYNNILEQLPTCLDEELLNLKLSNAGIIESEFLGQLKLFCKACNDLIAKLKDPSIERYEMFTLNPDHLISNLKSASQKLEIEALQYDEDAKNIDKSKIEEHLRELKARKWVAEQSDAIREELTRLEKVRELDLCIKSTMHTDISLKAGQVSEALITDAYVERFNEELKGLGASRIKVELVKRRVANANVMHSIKLRDVKNSSMKLVDVLSEGERRIVSIAAFLADIRGGDGGSTLVFDDPISSLDQIYEEKTVDRLIKLSCDRQVIVFTHRLSLVSLLDGKVKELDLICIEQERWGSGQPNERSIKGKRPEKILIKLKNEDLKNAQKVLDENGSESYFPLAIALCVNIRKTLEIIVELVFLNDVIQRHRREIHTKNKIHQLARIIESDCLTIDHYMSKYSVYLHSQSSEAYKEILQPEEIEEDLNCLLKWISEFSNRKLSLVYDKKVGNLN